MARKTGKSAFQKALVSHANDETDFGMEYIDLPAGIKGGIARLNEAKIGEYKSGDNQGEQFLYLSGVVVKPEKVLSITKAWQDGRVVVLGSEEVTVQGQRTSLMEPLCNTTKANGDTVSVDEHVSNALNSLRMLGVDTASIESEGDLESILSTLKDKENAPAFKFGTSARDPSSEYPNPRVWESWYGVVDYEGEEDEDVDDDTDKIPDEEPKEEGEDSDEYSVEELIELGEVADNDDEDAQKKLAELCKDAAIDPDEYDTWIEVADLLSNNEGDSEDTLVPEKGDVVSYKPPRARKEVHCEVTAVSSKSETCSLKNLDTEVVYKNVNWSELSEVEV